MYLLLAWYLGQVTGSGTGSQRHPLFFLGYHNASQESGQDAADISVAAKGNKGGLIRRHTTGALGRWPTFGGQRTHPYANGPPMKVWLEPTARFCSSCDIRSWSRLAHRSWRGFNPNCFT